MNIHPIGDVTFTPCVEGEEVGYTIVIGGKTTTLDVWWTDYATWLEEKLDEKKYKLNYYGINLETKGRNSN